MIRYMTDWRAARAGNVYPWGSISSKHTYIRGSNDQQNYKVAVEDGVLLQSVRVRGGESMDSCPCRIVETESDSEDEKLMLSVVPREDDERIAFITAFCDDGHIWKKNVLGEPLETYHAEVIVSFEGGINCHSLHLVVRFTDDYGYVRVTQEKAEPGGDTVEGEDCKTRDCVVFSWMSGISYMNHKDFRRHYFDGSEDNPDNARLYHDLSVAKSSRKEKIIASLAEKTALMPRLHAIRNVDLLIEKYTFSWMDGDVMRRFYYSDASVKIAEAADKSIGKEKPAPSVRRCLLLATGRHDEFIERFEAAAKTLAPNLMSRGTELQRPHFYKDYACYYGSIGGYAYSEEGLSRFKEDLPRREKKFLVLEKAELERWKNSSAHYQESFRNVSMRLRDESMQFIGHMNEVFREEGIPENMWGRCQADLLAKASAALV